MTKFFDVVIVVIFLPLDTGFLDDNDRRHTGFASITVGYFVVF